MWHEYFRQGAKVSSSYYVWPSDRQARHETEEVEGIIKGVNVVHLKIKLFQTLGNSVV